MSERDAGETETRTVRDGQIEESNSRSAPCDQFNHQNHQGDDKNQVNQTSRNMKSPT